MMGLQNITLSPIRPSQNNKTQDDDQNCNFCKAYFHHFFHVREQMDHNGDIGGILEILTYLEQKKSTHQKGWL